MVTLRFFMVECLVDPDWDFALDDLANTCVFGLLVCKTNRNTIKPHNFSRQLMPAATLSFRAPSEFAEQTKALARALSMTASDYVREAVREKNERALKERMVFLSRQLSTRHLAENQAMDASSGDGLG